MNWLIILIIVISSISVVMLMLIVLIMKFKKTKRLVRKVNYRSIKMLKDNLCSRTLKVNKGGNVFINKDKKTIEMLEYLKNRDLFQSNEAIIPAFYNILAQPYNLPLNHKYHHHLTLNISNILNHHHFFINPLHLLKHLFSACHIYKNKHVKSYSNVIKKGVKPAVTFNKTETNTLTPTTVNKTFNHHNSM